MIGLNFNYRNWNATAGYEFNDWLNQCQIFDDATGPHNNDLIVQGLSIRVSYSYGNTHRRNGCHELASRHLCSFGKAVPYRPMKC